MKSFGYFYLLEIISISGSLSISHGKCLPWMIFIIIADLIIGVNVTTKQSSFYSFGNYLQKKITFSSNEIMTNITLILIILLANNILITIQMLQMDYLNNQSQTNLLRIFQLYKQRCSYEEQGICKFDCSLK